jgi:hypothetical protein
VIGENTGHAALTPAELAFACAAMRAAAKADDTPLSTAEIADRVGRSEGYCAQLLQCVDHLIPPILEAWKGEKTASALPVDEAARFARMGQPKQYEQWAIYLGKLKAAPRGGGRKRVIGGARPCSRLDLEMLAERSKTLVSIQIDGKYARLKGRDITLVRTAVLATLRHVLDRDYAYPFQQKGK